VANASSSKAPAAQSKAPTYKSYDRFATVDGRHPFKKHVPDGFVDYKARRRHDGKVAYFNFDLAKEMGLIPKDHPERLNAELRKAILDTFCIVIINEYDIEHRTRFSKADILPHTYMATRYLQLQHPSRQGNTSGDGRSIWNGTIRNKGITWDISSCGTGVTKLCPATAHFKRYYKTGSALADYGCGTASIEEGLGSALTSETFYRNGIPTERVLAVISTPLGQSINVRAARNLLRPSHFFGYLKQGHLENLKASVDSCIDRQVSNGVWPAHTNRKTRYTFLAEEMARTFARVAATFEREYIFCWLDWDGDNILTDGAIIDYGSVRQLGLYHREYRFDDDPRWSTTIPEQRKKARYIVQCFAQIRDFLITGKKSSLDTFQKDPVLTLFDEEFEEMKRQLLLKKIGFPEAAQEVLLAKELPLIARFEKLFRHFEHAKSSRGVEKVPDGITWNAVFCMRDLLRELPARYCKELSAVPDKEFLEIACSTYAGRKERQLTTYRIRMIRSFQRRYLELVEAAAQHLDVPIDSLLAEISERSSIANRADRVTGDSLTHAAASLVRSRRQLKPDRISHVLKEFAEQQDLTLPEGEISSKRSAKLANEKETKLLETMLDLVDGHRHGL
jgi:uncharacterized protein YdiU (UPF0061 family)